MTARLVDHFLMIELSYALNVCANSLQSTPTILSGVLLT